MSSHDPHLTDRELVLLLDEDAGATAATARARRHLSDCAACSARGAGMAEALGGVEQAWHAGGTLPAPLAARARLVAGLDAASKSTWRSHVPWPAAAGLAVATLVLTILVWKTFEAGRPGARSAPVPAIAGPLLPRPHLTPGATRMVSHAELCAGAPAALHAPVSPVVPEQVFTSYGVDYRHADAFELDFLITPELGGAPEAANLWPQPYDAVLWNAYVKDELERDLLRLVCDGAIDLVEAQRALATDWIAAYKHRFDTDRPLRDYRRFPLTARDVEALRGEAVERRVLAALR